MSVTSKYFVTEVQFNLRWKKQVEEETEKVSLKKEDALRRDKWRDGVREIAEGMG